MKRLSILMYHGLYATEAQRLAIDPIDRPYALSTETFARQLDLLAAAHIPVIHPSALEQSGVTVPGGVLLTFDDGHASNAELALPLLKQRNLSALFFITTDFIGRRAGFCSWDQVRTLAQQGMVVGGHGQTHRFLSDLPDDALKTELRQSHARLEDELQMRVRQMSFPGGRYDHRCLRIARETGYTLLHGSATGALPARQVASSRPLPRLAIRSTTTDATFMAYARADTATLLRAQAVSHAKTWVKRLIGNARYHQLYARVKGVPHQQP
ncbi:MAG: polysaccharide deacetylase family protein [Thiomonas sp.]|uniref:polysaccharide deacetylase family protein n=1 Tax=Thiomonas sp. TaxID=2047785 RepID=UPI002A369EBE|nr:polysaccharide deacetylase family protein [Thiomonas sp.]MDY0331642.1 polysaccharide deacetylase family protein [Thiomonas sp.]